MKKRIAVLLTVGLCFVLFIYLFSFVDIENDNELLESMFDAEVYCYQYTSRELKNSYSDDNVFLYIVSLKVKDKTIETSDLYCNISDLENFGEFIEEMQNNEELTKDILEDKVELDSNRLYYYFVIKINKEINFSHPKIIDINAKNSTVRKKIDIFMNI